MGLEIGDIAAGSGMSKAIFDELNIIMSPPLEGMPQEDMEKIRDSWRKLAFAIATGVIEHIKSNMDIYGIETRGDVNTTVQGNTGPSDPGSHLHNVNLDGEQSDAVFTQSNDGTGHVK